MTPATGTLDGSDWEQPNLAKNVYDLSKGLPHLYNMVAAFFGGALETWERFTQEFGPETTLSQASSSTRSLIWNYPTNDASEGALGQARQMTRHMPAITDQQRNGRVMWTRNKTSQFVADNFTDADHAFVIDEARKMDKSGIPKKTRIRQNKAWKERGRQNKERRAKAQMRKSQHQQRLAGIQILVGATYEDLDKLTVRELDQQIDKLRELNMSILPKTKLGKRATKLAAVHQALVEYVPSSATASKESATEINALDQQEEVCEQEMGYMTGEECLLDAGAEFPPDGTLDDDDDEWKF